MKPIERKQSLIDILSSEEVQKNEKVIEYERMYIVPRAIDITKDYDTDTILKVMKLFLFLEGFFMKLGDTNKEIDKFIRVQIKLLVDKITTDQRKQFYRIYDSIQAIDINRYKQVVILLERTIIKNEKEYD